MSNITIAIPVRDCSRWIGQSIQSALNQTGIEHEVIVVDDGSTDGTEAVLRSFGKDIRILRADGSGGNVARNMALTEARGDWIQFLDADDYLLPGKIKTQLTEAGFLRGKDVIYSPVVGEHWENDTRIDSFIIEPRPDDDIYSRWLHWRVSQTGSVLWRVDSLRGIGGWNEKYPCCQDNEVTMRALQKGLSFCYTPTARAVYRVWSAGSVSTANINRTLEVKTDLILEMMNWLNQTERETEQHRAAAAATLFAIARQLASRDLDLARAHLQRVRAADLYDPPADAVPRAYRLLRRSIGFANTERIANFLRNRKPAK